MQRRRYGKSQCRGVGVVLLLLWLAGCASVPLASPAQDRAAKQFQPPPGSAHLYLVWTTPFGGTFLLHAVVDEHRAGALAVGTYLVFPLPPGVHRVRVVSAENEITLPLTLAAQQNYFVRIFPTRGLAVPRVGLELVDEATGREAVQGAALAQGLGDVTLVPPR